MIKKIFYYCYYRIAKGYRFWGDSSYLDWGYWVLMATFCLITLSIAVPIFHIFDMEFTKSAIILVVIPFILLDIWTTFFLSEKRKIAIFKQLEKRYKNEPHKTLKGWLVALYAVGTLVLYNVMCAIFA